MVLELIRVPRKEGAEHLVERSKGQFDAVRSNKVSEADVECNECGDDAQSTTSLGQWNGSCEFSNAKKKESDVQASKKYNETNVLLERTEEQEEGDHEPSHQVNAKTALKFSHIGECSKNTTARKKNGGIGQPECTIGCEGCGTKGVASGEFPHSSEELGKTTTEDGHSNYNIWLGDASCLKIVQGQDESGGSEREQTEGGRVCYVGTSSGVLGFFEIDMVSHLMWWLKDKERWGF